MARLAMRWNSITRPRATTGPLKPWPTSIFHANGGPDFGHAAGAGRDAESEPVQLDGRVDQAEPEAEPRGATALVATIKPSTHKVAFAGGNSRSGIADTSDDLVLPAMQAGFDTASLRECARR